MAKITTSKISAIVAFSIIATLALSSCSSTLLLEDSSISEDSIQGKVHSEGFAMDQSAIGAKGDSEDDSRNTEELAEVVTASMNLKVKNPENVASHIRTIVASVNGKVSYSVEQPGNEYEYGSANLVLRVPPSSLEGVTTAIKDYGVVISSESGSQDVSKEKTDYTVRIESLNTSINRLKDLLAQSESTADLIEIERELQARESELESMKAVLADLTDRIDYATLSIMLTADSKSAQPTKIEPENFFTGFERGLESLGVFGASLLVFAGLSLPWILVLAIIGSITMTIITIAKRRTRRQPVPPTLDHEVDSNAAMNDDKLKGTDG